MTLQELISQLQDFAEDYGDDTEVRLAFQPSWPFEHSIGAVALVDVNTDDRDLDDDGDDFSYEASGSEEFVVYIGEGRQIGYLPSEAKAELDWH